MPIASSPMLRSGLTPARSRPDARRAQDGMATAAPLRRHGDRSGPVRFHDFRHDFATKLLRETGNLKLVQRALNHADIKATLRYAHVTDEDLRAALERRSESRTESRTILQEIPQRFGKTGK
jgi:integrase